MARLFGTDGVRGVANSELTPELALSLGRAAALVHAAEKKRKPRLFTGMDTRNSFELL